MAQLGRTTSQDIEIMISSPALSPRGHLPYEEPNLPTGVYGMQRPYLREAQWIFKEAG